MKIFSHFGSLTKFSVLPVKCSSPPLNSLQWNLLTEFPEKTTNQPNKQNPYSSVSFHFDFQMVVLDSGKQLELLVVMSTEGLQLPPPFPEVNKGKNHSLVWFGESPDDSPVCEQLQLDLGLDMLALETPYKYVPEMCPCRKCHRINNFTLFFFFFLWGTHHPHSCAKCCSRNAFVWEWAHWYHPCSWHDFPSQAAVLDNGLIRPNQDWKLRNWKKKSRQNKLTTTSSLLTWRRMDVHVHNMAVIWVHLQVNRKIKDVLSEHETNMTEKSVKKFSPTPDPVYQFFYSDQQNTSWHFFQPDWRSTPRNNLRRSSRHNNSTPKTLFINTRFYHLHEIYWIVEKQTAFSCSILTAEQKKRFPFVSGLKKRLYSRVLLADRLKKINSMKN